MNVYIVQSTAGRHMRIVARTVAEAVECFISKYPNATVQAVNLQASNVLVASS